MATNLDLKPYLRKIKIETPDEGKYPFNIPALKNLKELNFETQVTYIIGENGVGKSTLIEAIAVKMGLNAEGGNQNTIFNTKETHSDLHKYMKPVKGAYRPKFWYFLRAESFYNVASKVDEIGYIGSYGGKSLHEQSHGESFMSVLSNKLHDGGFYIFDEPEAALSPQRQLSALIEIDRLVKGGSQIIITTHSPILMSYPNSTILQLSEDGVKKVNYKDTEHYKVTKDFLNKTELMLKELLR